MHTQIVQAGRRHIAYIQAAHTYKEREIKSYIKDIQSPTFSLLLLCDLSA